jgi:hypothetical protein
MFGHGSNEQVSDAILRCGKKKADAKTKSPDSIFIEPGLAFVCKLFDIG